MRVLNVNMSVDPFRGGGTAERTLQISRALNERGVSSAIVCADPDVADVHHDVVLGSPVIRLPAVHGRFSVPWVSQRTIRNIVRDFDIVHLMNHWTPLNASVYRSCRALGKPYVICPAGALPVYGRSKLKKHGYNMLVGRRIVRHADGRVAITRQEVPQFVPYGVSPSDVVVIPNGIAPRDFENYDVPAFRSRHHLPDAPIILFAGRLNMIKGPDLLLDAFLASAPVARACHLVFAGPDGGMLDALMKQAAASFASERIHFVGFLAGEARASAYRAAQLLVIPSRHEAMSLVALEAGICGTPVLLTDQCGFDEIEQVGGGSVVPADSASLARGLERLLVDETTLRGRGGALQEYIRANYLWSIVVDRYIRLFEAILARRLSTPSQGAA